MKTVIISSTHKFVLCGYLEKIYLVFLNAKRLCEPLHCELDVRFCNSEKKHESQSWFTNKCVGSEYLEQLVMDTAKAAVRHYGNDIAFS